MGPGNLLSLVLLVASPSGDGWVERLVAMPGLEARFVQSSQSEIFGEVKGTGRIQVSRGGRIRVQYDKGQLMVCDGSLLVDYDPGMRTARRMTLASAIRQVPLLSLLADPSSLGVHFTVKSLGPDRAILEPRAKGGTKLEVQLRGGLPSVLTWTDPTGSRQVLTLEGVKPAPAFPAGTFAFKLPAGARWGD